MTRLILFFFGFFTYIICEAQIPQHLTGNWVLAKAIVEEQPLNKPNKINQVVLLPKQTNEHFMFRSCILEMNCVAMQDPDLQVETAEKSTIMIYPEMIMKDPKVSILGNTISFREFSPESKSEKEDPLDTHLTYTYRLESDNSLILSAREVFYNSPLQVPLRGQLHIYLIRK